MTPSRARLWVLLALLLATAAWGESPRLSHREQLRREVQERRAKELAEETRKADEAADSREASAMVAASEHLGRKAPAVKVSKIQDELEAMDHDVEKARAAEPKKASLPAPRKTEAEVAPLRYAEEPLPSHSQEPHLAAAVPVRTNWLLPAAGAAAEARRIEASAVVAKSLRKAAAKVSTPAPESHEDKDWVVDKGRPEPLEEKPWVFRGLATYPAPEQGYHGPLVVHKDLETFTKDWGKEFGPRGPDSACGICLEKQHVNEWWCRRNLKDLCLDGAGSAAAVHLAASAPTVVSAPEVGGSDGPPAPRSAAAAVAPVAPLLFVAALFF